MEERSKIDGASRDRIRRACERLISSGRVFVNGKPAVLGQKADLSKDRIEVEGQRIKNPEKKDLYSSV